MAAMTKSFLGAGLVQAAPSSVRGKAQVARAAVEFYGPNRYASWGHLFNNFRLRLIALNIERVAKAPPCVVVPSGWDLSLRVLSHPT